jgi:hypothetical protein
LNVPVGESSLSASKDGVQFSDRHSLPRGVLVSAAPPHGIRQR